MSKGRVAAPKIAHLHFAIERHGTYTQAVTPMKRAAQTKIVKMILVPSNQAGEKQASGK